MGIQEGARSLERFELIETLDADDLDVHGLAKLRRHGASADEREMIGQRGVPSEDDRHGLDEGLRVEGTVDIGRGGYVEERRTLDRMMMKVPIPLLHLRQGPPFDHPGSS